MGHGETGGTLVAPIIRDFLKEALKDVPPVPFRAPPGIKLVRVNHKIRPARGSRRQDRHLEAFKPGQEPMGSTVEEPSRGAGKANPWPGRFWRCPTAADGRPCPLARRRATTVL